MRRFESHISATFWNPTSLLHQQTRTTIEGGLFSRSSLFIILLLIIVVMLLLLRLLSTKNTLNLHFECTLGHVPIFCVKDFYQMFLYYVNTTSIDHLWSLTTGGLCQQLITYLGQWSSLSFEEVLGFKFICTMWPFAKVEVKRHCCDSFALMKVTNILN